MRLVGVKPHMGSRAIEENLLTLLSRMSEDGSQGVYELNVGFTCDVKALLPCMVVNVRSCLKGPDASLPKGDVRISRSQCNCI
jgi:hypothetical protein